MSEKTYPFYPTRISKSMIETYAFCPMQYKHVYRDGKRDPENFAMTLGTRFHDFAQTFFVVCENLPCDWWELLIPVEFNDLEYKMASWFIKNERKRLFECLKNPDMRFEPYSVEGHLEDKDLMIHGYVDRIDINSVKNKTLTVIEYKTGLSFNERSIRRQCCLYGLMVEYMTEGEYTCSEYKYINPRTQEVKVYKDHHSTRRATKNIIKKLWKDIHNDEFEYDCSAGKWLACGRCKLEDVEEIINERYNKWR